MSFLENTLLADGRTWILKTYTPGLADVVQGLYIIKLYCNSTLENYLIQLLTPDKLFTQGVSQPMYTVLCMLDVPTGKSEIAVLSKSSLLN